MPVLSEGIQVNGQFDIFSGVFHVLEIFKTKDQYDLLFWSHSRLLVSKAFKYYGRYFLRSPVNMTVLSEVIQGQWSIRHNCLDIQD